MKTELLRIINPIVEIQGGTGKGNLATTATTLRLYKNDKGVLALSADAPITSSKSVYDVVVVKDVLSNESLIRSCSYNISTAYLEFFVSLYNRLAANADAIATITLSPDAVELVGLYAHTGLKTELGEYSCDGIFHLGVSLTPDIQLDRIPFEISFAPGNGEPATVTISLQNYAPRVQGINATVENIVLEGSSLVLFDVVLPSGVYNISYTNTAAGQNVFFL